MSQINVTHNAANIARIAFSCAALRCALSSPISEQAATSAVDNGLGPLTAGMNTALLALGFILAFIPAFIPAL